MSLRLEETPQRAEDPHQEASITPSVQTPRHVHQSHDKYIVTRLVAPLVLPGRTAAVVQSERAEAEQSKKKKRMRVNEKQEVLLKLEVRPALLSVAVGGSEQENKK